VVRYIIYKKSKGKVYRGREKQTIYLYKLIKEERKGDLIAMLYSVDLEENRLNEPRFHP
jgi:hypothetical protein